MLQAITAHAKWIKGWKKWHAPKLYYLLDARECIKFAFGLFAFSLSLSEQWLRCLANALDVQSTSKLIDMIWLWYCPNIRFNSHKRKFFSNFIELLRWRKKKQRDFEMAFRWKCDELRRYWCFCCCRCSVVRIGDFSYQNNQYSIFISFSITLFMWCMWRMRANRNKIVCIKWRKFGIWMNGEHCMSS